MSALWKLPVIFVCENNLYGLSVSIKKTSSVEDIAIRAKAHGGMPGNIVDGMDVLEVYGAAKDAVKRAKEGKGPSLIECKTYRFLGHSRGDPPFGPYRTREEWEIWKKRDPLTLFPKNNGLTPNEIQEIETQVNREIEEAIHYAEESPLPDVETVLQDIYT